MADKYISAEQLKRDLIDNRSFFPVIVARAIEDAPAADVVEVKHGYWKLTGRKLTCSECNRKKYVGTDDEELLKEEAALNKFCFNCGAKMDGGGK